MSNNLKNTKKLEQHEYIKNLEIGFFVLATILLTIGVMVVMYGSTSMAKYYVEPVNADNFFGSLKEFLQITIKYSTTVYGGLLIVACSVIAFIISIIAYVYDFEYYKEKTKELSTVLQVVNPENKKIKTVEIGEKYIPLKSKK